jgi:GTP pyrophosphokinase
MGRDILELADGSLFIEKIRNSFQGESLDLLIRAYGLAQEKSIPGNLICLRAADLLLEQDADAVTVAAALVAPLLWDQRIGPAELENHFGPSFLSLLEGWNPLSEPPFDHQHRGYVYSLLSSMGEDIPRKALLNIAFRLLALETAIDSSEKDATRTARETLALYVPIADRLSLGDLRRRLEDACFQILDPAGYADLKQEVAPIQAEDNKCLEILMVGIQRLMDNNGVRGRVQGRTKSLHAIRRKMERTGKTLKEIMDRIGLRAIVSSVPECYTVLGLLHFHFKPIPGTFDDYIGLPKDNGYQSLHTCVYPVREISQKPIEIQIRTELMHSEAEHGTAAHWRYKSRPSAMTRDRYHALWMRGLAKQYEKSDNTLQFVELLYRQVFQNHLVVFGNGGRIVRLAEKATLQDYLTITNVKIPSGGSVKVNGETATLDRALRDGDSIEIIPNPEIFAENFSDAPEQKLFEGLIAPGGLRAEISQQPSDAGKPGV